MYKYLIGVLLVAAIPFAGVAQQHATELPARDFQTAWLNSRGAVLLDVRSAEEMREGYISGADNLDYNSGQLADSLSKLDKNKTYYVYCLSGIRSRRAAELMRENGFRKIITLEGGLKEWNAERLPLKVERKP